MCLVGEALGCSLGYHCGVTKEEKEVIFLAVGPLEGNWKAIHLSKAVFGILNTQVHENEGGG